MKACELKKFDNALQIVWGEVYVPGFPDSQGEFMTVDEVRKMAHHFAAVERLGAVDVMHDGKTYEAFVVESFVARDGDPDFIPGAWVAGVHVKDEELWGRIRNGELNGFSLEGLALRHDEPSVINVDVPEVVICSTLKSDTVSHVHQVKLFFDDIGNIVSGETSFDDGHRHTIVRGTVTEKAGSPEHQHKFSFLEEVLGAA